MRKIIGLLFIAMLMLSGIAAAAEEKEPGFWSDPNYDFSQVRRVCVLDPNFSEEIKADEVGTLKKLFLKNARLRNVTVLSMNDVIEKVKKDRGIDIWQLKTKQERVRALLGELPQYADIVIDAKIVRSGIIVRDSPMVTGEVSRSDGNDYNKPIYGNNNEVIGYEQKSYDAKVRISGGRGEPLLVAKIDWNVYDLRTNKAVIVSTQEGSAPMKILSQEYGIDGIDLRMVRGYTTQRVCELAIQSFFGELSTRINGQ